MAVDLTNRQEVERFAADAAKFRDYHGCADLMIVFDTLNLCMGDGDENSSKDTGRVLANATYLAKPMERTSGFGILLLTGRLKKIVFRT
ncbi:helicase RepA family protein [Ruegeria marisrubri]|uniref:helicase RepA family protein n=1 Tax=Ruegeria marisrubri TaxID=1685379 RepID=UPI001CD73541|nr:helicase RepA family protein [Ruegeria marisrubri]MCA0905469.1 helicase RepA family protein [Ruegeria marisrubri]